MILNFLDVFSSFGGMLGLMCGMSILSVLEVFCFLLLVVVENGYSLLHQHGLSCKT